MLTLDELKERKRQLGLSNKEVAAISGVPLGTVQKVFGGTTGAPRRSTLEILSSALQEGSYADLNRAGTFHETEFSYNAKAMHKIQGEYTAEDFYNVPDDRMVELIDGEIYDMCTPSIEHQDIVLNLAMQFQKCIEEKCDGKCKTFISPLGVQIDEDDYSILVPDLFISCDSSKWSGKIYRGAPDLVVEVVSPTSIVRDRIIKLNKYWHAKVKEYWIVDPKSKEVEVNLFDDNILGKKYNFGMDIPVGISKGKCKIKN